MCSLGTSKMSTSSIINESKNHPTSMFSGENIGVTLHGELNHHAVHSVSYLPENVYKRFTIHC